MKTMARGATSMSECLMHVSNRATMLSVQEIRLSFPKTVSPSMHRAARSDGQAWAESESVVLGSRLL
jgi:hypothetical protein